LEEVRRQARGDLSRETPSTESSGRFVTVIDLGIPMSLP
jgi:hypothetical protein